MKRIITAAVTGATHVPSLSPHFPFTPEQIVEDAVGAAKAGAAVVHIHARDPMDGHPTSDIRLFHQIIEGISSQCDAAICVTTGGSTAMTIDERVAPLHILTPELASLNSGSLNFAFHQLADKLKDPRFDWEVPYLQATENLVFSNTFRNIKIFAQAMRETGTKAELEVYDAGMINNIKHLVDVGALETPVYMQFVLGILGGMPATPENLVFLVESARKALGDENVVWSCCAAGKAQLPIGCVGLALGGNVRVGLEDNLYIGPGRLARNSAEQVGAIVRIATELSLEIATPAEAREILGLKGKDKVCAPQS
jgi:uncharacterized protein (DUF849 family)